jgi:hypothetical protein
MICGTELFPIQIDLVALESRNVCNFPISEVLAIELCNGVQDGHLHILRYALGGHIFLASSSEPKTGRQREAALWPIRCTPWCTPGMGVNLWSGSPLYETLKVLIVMDTNKSTSRRQGREGVQPSEGSRSANVRA